MTEALATPPAEGEFAEVDLDDRRTPPHLWQYALQRWGPFTVDVAANKQNAPCPRYFDREMNGLAQCWARERCWGNIPFSDIPPWIQKAWDSDADVVVFVVPANRTDQRWWQRDIEPFRDRPGSRLTTHFPPGRPRFGSPTRATHHPRFGVVLLAWGARPAGSGA